MLAQLPGRAADFSLELSNLLDTAVGIQPIQVPPVVIVGNKVEHTAWAEQGLHQCALSLRGDLPNIGQLPLAVEIPKPQLGIIPRHIGVFPGDPGKLCIVALIAGELIKS